MLSVYPGYWAAYHAVTPVVMFQLDYITHVDMHKLMWGLTHAYLDREVTQRARECFTGWQVVYPSIVGDRMLDHVNVVSLNEVEFKWKARHSASSTWKRKSGLVYDMGTDGGCGAVWALIAAVCRNFMNSRIFRHRFMVQGVEEREWGRLLSFLQTSLGQTKYKEERDTLRGGRPSGRRERRPMEDIPFRDEGEGEVPPQASMPPPPSREPRAHPRVTRIREEAGVSEVVGESRRITRSMSRSRSPQVSEREESPQRSERSFRTGERRSPPSPSYSPSEGASMETRSVRSRSRLGPTATQEPGAAEQEAEQ